MKHHVVIGSTDEGLTAFRLRHEDLWPGDTVAVLPPFMAYGSTPKRYVVDRDGFLREVK